MRLIKTALSFFLFALCSSVFAADTRFLAISDIHFNPFDEDTKTYPIADKITDNHNDTNLVYLNKAIDNMASSSAAEMPKFIVITGDLLAHHFQEKWTNNDEVCYGKDKDGKPIAKKMSVDNCILESIDTIITRIRAQPAFKSIPIYISVGNNDSDLGDYTVDQPFLNKLGDKIYTYSHPGNDKERTAFVADFVKNAGAYNIANIANKLNLVSLNTVLYANKPVDPEDPKKGLQLKCVAKDRTPDDCDTLRKQQNQFINNYKASSEVTTLVLTHIPPYVADKGYNLLAPEKLSNKIFNLPRAFVLAGHWHMYGKLAASAEANLKGYMLSSITYRGEEGAIPTPGFVFFNYNDSAPTGANMTITEKTHCELPFVKEQISGHVVSATHLEFKCEKKNNEFSM